MNQLDLYEEEVVCADDMTDMSVIEPHDDDDVDVRNTEGTRKESKGTARLTPTYVPSGVRKSDWGSHLDATEEAKRKQKKSNHRLSVPPPCKLDPPKTSARPLSMVPRKSDAPDTSYTPHPVYPVDKWIVRTPSPVKSIREVVSTPPLGGRRAMSPAALMSVIASSWKRRGTPSAEYANDVDSGRTSRSVS
jgi:hypothetical protein